MPIVRPRYVSYPLLNMPSISIHTYPLADHLFPLFASSLQRLSLSPRVTLNGHLLRSTLRWVIITNPFMGWTWNPYRPYSSRRQDATVVIQRLQTAHRHHSWCAQWVSFLFYHTIPSLGGGTPGTDADSDMGTSTTRSNLKHTQHTTYIFIPPIHSFIHSTQVHRHS